MRHHHNKLPLGQRRSNRIRRKTDTLLDNWGLPPIEDAPVEACEPEASEDTDGGTTTG